MIHIGTVWRKGFCILLFEDVGVFGVFERNGGWNIGGWNGIDLDGRGFECSVDGGFKLGDIYDGENKELVLWMDVSGRQNNRKATTATASGGCIG
jgi:hypothetical protein